MKILLNYITIVIFLFSCSNSENANTVKEVRYNLYTQNDSLIEADFYKVEYKKENSNFDFITVYNSDFKKIIDYKQIVSSLGILRNCDTSFLLTHSLNDTNTKSFCINKPPFLNKEIILKNKKKYTFRGVDYVIYHFIENTNNHSLFDSYYLENGLALCYYSFDNAKYILVKNVKGFSIDNVIVDSIKYQLIKDTVFFAKYPMNKLMPNYHRPNFPVDYFK